LSGSASGEFIATAWNNGGSSYGIKISRNDRDKFLNPIWPNILLRIPGLAEAVEVGIAKASMWQGNCRELIHKQIGDWLRREGAAPWPKGRPPRVRVKRLGERTFELHLDRTKRPS
jgi:hypothetical protein